MSDRVIWYGPPTPWAEALGAVQAVDTPAALADAVADLVVLAGSRDALAGWLGRPNTRPPVLAVTATEEDEDEALALGAEAVVGPDASVEEARRAVRHARLRHGRFARPSDASEARYRTVVRALPDVVSRLTTDGHVLDFHVPAPFETEFPAEAMLGRRLQDVIPADLAGKFEAAVERLRQSDGTVAYDYAVEADGRTLHREVRMAAIGDDEVLSMLRDVTPLREHEAALERSRAELRALATHLQDVREEERTRLSREVHDVLGQQLTAIRLGVGWFGRHFADDAAAQGRLAKIREVIDETIGHVRQIAADLRPGVLDDFGLASAVEWEAGRFENRTETPCAVEIVGDAEPPADVATATFRVLQEALTNVARHAGAGRVEVRLALDPDRVHLVVADDGAGIGSAAGGRRSLGLIGMRERAGALGGTVGVRPGAERGTVVECTFPLASGPPPAP